MTIIVVIHDFLTAAYIFLEESRKGLMASSIKTSVLLVSLEKFDDGLFDLRFCRLTVFP